jgi:hypothetical protein
MSALQKIGVVTTYGYAGDTTPDRNSANGIGAWDNHLRETSIAVSRDIEAQFRAAGILPMSKVKLLLDNGKTVEKTWDDRTAKTYKGKPLIGRFDFYCPSGRNPHEGQGIVNFSRVT